jgi:hypothetical protein
MTNQGSPVRIKTAAAPLPHAISPAFARGRSILESRRRRNYNDPLTRKIGEEEKRQNNVLRLSALTLARQTNFGVTGW